ncbi:hypothetical protein [Actinacidiphila acidipaludis]|uniref:Uncharacterized protein n=1 Tax=Actinacidiphila acidipaludis TaxID=2873382 RepID=A0ABS7Q4J1_9ACTN|nr:hypothetical protein [Streptomyces acidipaludis]MBY8878076.1 hypothetical protein [Streptomyces acidipaludis]
MTVRSSWLLDSGQTRQDTRLSPLGTFTPTSPLATRSGVIPGSADGTTRLSGFTATGTGMTVTVFPGRAVVQGSELQGAYPVALTEQVSLTVPDGDPQPRIDLIVLRVYDNLFDSKGLYEASVELIGGAAGPLPQPPPLPAGALALYQITVPAGASAGTKPIQWETALSGQRTATVAVGGILPVTSDTTPGAYPGQYRDAGGSLQRWDGTAWQPYPPVPQWQDWTPVWTTSTGSAPPSFGNAQLKCRYVQDGPTVHAKVDIQFGSSTVFGAGATYSDNWTFSLPVPAVAGVAGGGFAEMEANSAGSICIARLYVLDTHHWGLATSSGRVDGTAITTTGYVDSVTPWIWANQHTIRGTFSYEAAV